METRMKYTTEVLMRANQTQLVDTHRFWYLCVREDHGLLPVLGRGIFAFANSKTMGNYACRKGNSY